MLLGRATTTAVWLVIFGATGVGFVDDHQPLDVRRDVVSISEIRPSVILTPKRVYIESLKRKLKKQKLRTNADELRKMGWHATPVKAQAIAWILVKPRSWRGEEWQCLKKLWEKESSWRWNAQNPDSGAGGIPQALPARKMASAGRDWLHSAYTQIRWGLKYIKDRYFTPCGAWSHSKANNWY